MTSSRLPGKILSDITGELNSIKLLSHRIQNANMIDRHIYAIPDSSANDSLANYLNSMNYDYIRGSESDLISRYMLAVNDADIIVRITSDCPLVDPAWIDVAVSLLKATNADYVSNYTPASTSLFCNGSDIEVFKRQTLLELDKKFLDPTDREHVTFPLWDGRLDVTHLKMNSLLGDDISDVRITLDYEEDLEVLRRLANIINLKSATLTEIVSAYRKFGMSQLNGRFEYNAGWC